MGDLQYGNIGITSFDCSQIVVNATAKSQIVGVQKTVDTMIEEQAEKCKVAGTAAIYILTE